MSLDFSLILNKITSPVLVVEAVRNVDGVPADFKIVFANDAFRDICGSIVGSASLWSEFRSAVKSGIPYFEMAKSVLAGQKTGDVTYFSPERKSWYKVDMTSKDDFVIVTFVDVTSEKRYARRLKESVFKDNLTGLPNRTCFSDTLDMILDTSRYYNKKAGLLVIDIDDMKNINDSLGGDAGDDVIRHVADVLRRFERDDIKVFRYGDDEFALVMSNLESVDTIANIADAVFEAFQMEHISVSGGISVCPDHSEQKNELIRFADMAIHYVKKHGKDSFSFFEPDMQRVFIRQLTLHNKMNSAVAENSFRLFYQPQFDIQSGKLRGFEALIRWHDDDLGDVSPGVFIPAAEESGLIVSIGEWVMDTALSTLKKWQTDFGFDGIMSVNVSPLQLRQENFIYDVATAVARHGIDPKFLEIEITEGVMISNFRAAIDKLNSIKSMGLRISLDDFGTGYSSLNYLQLLPLNTLKIDKSFITGITENNGIQANITSSIISMVQKMGLETIAEGVEYPAQLSLLKKFNCNVVQGFLRGKPMPEELCDLYLSGNSSVLLTN